MRVLITGGAASGKSQVAEAIALLLGGPFVYLATMRPQGSEAQAKIRRHLRQRAGKGFETVECCRSVGSCALPPNAKTVLLECVSNLVDNSLYTPAESGEGFVLNDQASVCDSIAANVEGLAQRCENLVIVTNEVGASGEQVNDQIRAYVNTMGTVNCRLAARCDVVAEVVCGQVLPARGASLLGQLGTLRAEVRL